MVTVPTSAGEISVDDLGVVLMHEHVFIRTETLQWGWPGFGGWDERGRGGGRPRAAGPAQARGRGHHPRHDHSRPGPRSGAGGARGRGHGPAGDVRDGLLHAGLAALCLPVPRAGQVPRRRRPAAGVAVRAGRDQGHRRHRHPGGGAQARHRRQGHDPGRDPAGPRGRERQRPHRHRDLHARQRGDPARARPAADLRRVRRGPRQGGHRALQRDHRPGLPAADHRRRLLRRLGPVRPEHGRAARQPAGYPGRALLPREREPGDAVPRQGLVHGLLDAAPRSTRSCPTGSTPI